MLFPLPRTQTEGFFFKMDLQDFRLEISVKKAAFQSSHGDNSAKLFAAIYMLPEKYIQSYASPLGRRGKCEAGSSGSKKTRVQSRVVLTCHVWTGVKGDGKGKVTWTVCAWSSVGPYENWSAELSSLKAAPLQCIWIFGRRTLLS